MEKKKRCFRKFEIEIRNAIKKTHNFGVLQTKPVWPNTNANEGDARPTKNKQQRI